MTSPMTFTQDDDGFEDSMVCECEQDWSCGLHSDQAPWIDRRYQGEDADEARYFGRPWDA
jgi:hypothetical protein